MRKAIVRWFWSAALPVTVGSWIGLLFQNPEFKSIVWVWFTGLGLLTALHVALYVMVDRLKDKP